MSLFYSAGLSGSAIPDSGVARLTFDTADIESGTALDVWDNNDGTINGVTTGVQGEINEAYSFDGVDDYVETPVAPTSGGFSVSVWVNVDSSQNNNFSAAVSTRNEDGADGEMEISANSDNDEFRANVDRKTVGTTAWTTGVWKHLVLTTDGSNAEFYVDAASIGTATGVSIDRSKTFDVARRPAGDNYLSADVDDPRWYSKQLSESEVSNLYNTGSIIG